MRIVIDRIDENIAHLDIDGTIIEFPSAALPEGSREGDLLGFVKLDNSEIVKEGEDRIARMQAMSDTADDLSFDL